MKPGRELDALVAEKVMGWVWQPVPWMNNEQSMLVPHAGYLVDEDARVRLGMMVYEFVPNYSTDISKAWLVVEKTGMFRELRLGQGILVGGDEWIIFKPFWEDMDWYVEGDTPAHAICLAALFLAGIRVLS